MLENDPAARAWFRQAALEEVHEMNALKLGSLPMSQRAQQDL